MELDTCSPVSMGPPSGSPCSQVSSNTASSGSGEDVLSVSPPRSAHQLHLHLAEPPPQQRQARPSLSSASSTTASASCSPPQSASPRCSTSAPSIPASSCLQSLSPGRSSRSPPAVRHAHPPRSEAPSGAADTQDFVTAAENDRASGRASSLHSGQSSSDAGRRHPLPAKALFELDDDLPVGEMACSDAGAEGGASPHPDTSLLDLSCHTVCGGEAVSPEQEARRPGGADPAVVEAIDSGSCQRIRSLRREREQQVECLRLLQSSVPEGGVVGGGEVARLREQNAQLRLSLAELRAEVRSTQADLAEQARAVARQEVEGQLAAQEQALARTLASLQHRQAEALHDAVGRAVEARPTPRVEGLTADAATEHVTLLFGRLSKAQEAAEAARVKDAVQASIKPAVKGFVEGSLMPRITERLAATEALMREMVVSRVEEATGSGPTEGDLAELRGSLRQLEGQLQRQQEEAVAEREERVRQQQQQQKQKQKDIPVEAMVEAAAEGLESKVCREVRDAESRLMEALESKLRGFDESQMQAAATAAATACGIHNAQNVDALVQKCRDPIESATKEFLKTHSERAYHQNLALWTRVKELEGQVDTLKAALHQQQQDQEDRQEQQRAKSTPPAPPAPVAPAPPAAAEAKAAERPAPAPEMKVGGVQPGAGLLDKLKSLESKMASACLETPPSRRGGGGGSRGGGGAWGDYQKRMYKEFRAVSRQQVGDTAPPAVTPQKPSPPSTLLSFGVSPTTPGMGGEQGGRRGGGLALGCGRGDGPPPISPPSMSSIDPDGDAMDMTQSHQQPWWQERVQAP